MRWPPNLMIHLQAIHPVHSTCLFLLASAAGLAAHASTSYPAMTLFLRFAVLCCCVIQVGGDRSFDPTVYQHNLVINRQQQVDSLQRSYVGSGDILAFHPGGGHVPK
jgi:hypothetical protein